MTVLSRLMSRTRARARGPGLAGMLAHLIHRIAEIRWRAYSIRQRLESHRDWFSTPLSMSGQNLPCPPRTTIRFYHSLCQVSARRRSPPHSTVAGSVPTVVSYFLAGIDRQLGLIDTLAAIIPDHRDPDLVTHSMADSSARPGVRHRLRLPGC